jgi:hypothetical protein
MGHYSPAPSQEMSRVGRCAVPNMSVFPRGILESRREAPRLRNYKRSNWRIFDKATLK